MRLWLDGRVVEDPRAPVLSAFDHGFLVGDGVFETVKVVAGVPFALSRHLARLSRSAAGLALPPPDHDRIRAAVEELLAGQEPSAARLRITCTSGFGPPGSDRGGDGCTLAVAVADLPARAASASVVTVPWPRNERGALAGVKSTSYAENAVALAYAHERGGSEAILANTRDQLCEGTGSNVFVVRSGQVLTPPLTAGCLAGVTRDLVLEWCPEIVEQDLPMSILAEADEVFLTSTTRDVQPVDRVDGRPLPAPGPVTEKVREVFAGRAADQVDP